MTMTEDTRERDVYEATSFFFHVCLRARKLSIKLDIPLVSKRKHINLLIPTKGKRGNYENCGVVLNENKKSYFLPSINFASTALLASS
jgi:hypothetical protein